MRYEVSGHVHAAVERVWAVLADVERMPEWSPSMTSVRLLDQRPFALGSRARLAQPRLPAAVWEVTEFTDGLSFSWTTRRPGVTTAGEHRLAPRDDGTTVTLALQQTGLLAAPAYLLVGSLVRRYVDAELAGLLARCAQPPSE